MTKKEFVDILMDKVKRDTYRCDKCKIVPKYSMQKFNKLYKKEFDKRVNEIWDWHKTNPEHKHITLGCVGRLMNIVLGNADKVKNDAFNPGHYRFKGYQHN